MKLREGASTVLAILLAIGWGYSSYTAQDFSELRDLAQNHAQEVKQLWVKERQNCKVKGNYRNNSLCKKIKQYDPKARELWKKLKKADKKAEIIEENLHRLETIKEILFDVKSTVGNV